MGDRDRGWDRGEVHIYSAFQTRSWLRPWL